MSNKVSKKIKKIGKKVKKHPKIFATIVFFLLIGIFSFSWGYKQDVEKTDKNGNKYPVSHHFLNGMKWLGIIFTIFFIIVIIFVFVIGSDFTTYFFFGGEIIGGLLQLIGSLLTELGK